MPFYNTTIAMDSFNQTPGFRYNPSSNRMSHHSDDESEFSGILDTYVHHARNFQNIFIYDNQDVYAKFYLAYNPGKNPDFNENLRLKITQVDAVQKCEIWMLSRARNYLE